MLSPEAVMEFQRLFEKTYGRKITYDEALLQGTRLVELFRIVYGSSISKLQKIKKKGGESAYVDTNDRQRDGGPKTNSRGFI